MNIFKRILSSSVSATKVTERVKNEIITSAFKFSTTKEVTEMLNFREIEEPEWGRIVNEIYASAIVMIELMLETITQITEGERQKFFKEVRDGIFKSYTDHLVSIGAKDEHVKIWSKLLEKRRDEFWEDRNHHRHELPEPDKGNPWLYVAAIAGLENIRKGKTSPEDPFYKIFLSWLRDLSGDIAKILLKSANIS